MCGAVRPESDAAQPHRQAALHTGLPVLLACKRKLLERAVAHAWRPARLPAVPSTELVGYVATGKSKSTV